MEPIITSDQLHEKYRWVLRRFKDGKKISEFVTPDPTSIVSYLEDYGLKESITYEISFEEQEECPDLPYEESNVRPATEKWEKSARRITPFD